MTAARTGWTRRRVLTLGLASAGAVAAGVAGAERGILPGKAVLDTLDGACSVRATAVTFAPLGFSNGATYRILAPGNRHYLVTVDPLTGRVSSRLADS